MFVLRFYFDILMKGSMFLAHLWLVTCGGLDRLLSTISVLQVFKCAFVRFSKLLLIC